MSCYPRNFIINDLVNNHELGCLNFGFHHEVDHIIFYKVDRPLGNLKTCYENLDGTHLQLFRL